MVRWMRALKKRLLKLVVRLTSGYGLRAALLRIAGYSVGRRGYIGKELIIADTEYQLPQLFIGDEVTIAQGVTLDSKMSTGFLGPRAGRS